MLSEQIAQNCLIEQKKQRRIQKFEKQAKVEIFEKMVNGENPLTVYPQKTAS